MLRSYLTESKRFDFIQAENRTQVRGNTFTVIVGKNGVGKSRLLRALVTKLFDGVVDRTKLAREERLNVVADERGYLDLERSPTKIICVSTSPFDKFPILRRDHFVEGYSYLGMRGLPTTNLGLSYRLC